MSTPASYFELTDETITAPDGTVLHRIRALVDLPRHGVKAGDIGGWVEKANNLFGGAWVFGGAQVFGGAWVYGGAQVFGGARVFGGAQVFGDARVFGGARVSGGARVEIRQDILTVSPIGSESITATLYRTTDGHVLHVGCWTGTVDTLPAEVEQRAKKWRCDTTTATRYRAEYAALEELCRARITAWETPA